MAVPSVLAPALAGVAAACAAPAGGAPVRVAVVGSRGFAPLSLVSALVAALPAGVVVVSGGARGVDRAAVAAAGGRGLACEELPAAWSSLGRAAGPVRSAALVRSVSVVVAFWDGYSRGTAAAVAAARRAGVPVFVVRAQEEQPALFKRWLTLV